MSLPLLVRPNSVIPIGSRTDRPDYDFSDGVRLQVYPLEDGKQMSVEIPSLGGQIETRFEVKREGRHLHMQRHGPAKQWSVTFAGAPSAEVKYKAGTSETTIQLPE